MFLSCYFLNSYFTTVYTPTSQLYELTDAEAEQEEEIEKKEDEALEKLNALYSKNYSKLNEKIKSLDEKVFYGSNYHKYLKNEIDKFLKTLNEINQLAIISNENNFEVKKNLLI